MGQLTKWVWRPQYDNQQNDSTADEVGVEAEIEQSTKQYDRFPVGWYGGSETVAETIGQ